MTPTGVAQLPGFAESVRLLLEVERYSMRDVARMFGISAERLRQLCEKFGIPRSPKWLVGNNAVRVWCDATHRFVPVPRGAYQAAEAQHRRVRYWQDVDARILDRRQRVVTCYHDLKTQLRRRPTLQEWASAVYRRPIRMSEAGGRLVGYWGRHPRLAELYAAVGESPRGRGSPGHVQRRRRAPLPIPKPMATFDFVIQQGTAPPLRQRVQSTDVVAATRAVQEAYPTAQILECVAVQDVLWAVREVEAQARAS